MEKERKLQIIKAAEKRFVKHGINKTTLEEIARDLRIGKSTIYHYFGSKEDLYFSTLKWQVEQYHSRLKTILSASKEPAEIIEDYLSFKETVFEQYKMILSLFLQFMNDSSLEEEKDILELLYTGEEQMFKELFSKVHFKQDELNFSFFSFIVRQTWGIVLNRRITSKSEALSLRNEMILLRIVFESVLK